MNALRSALSLVAAILLVACAGGEPDQDPADRVASEKGAEFDFGEIEDEFEKKLGAWTFGKDEESLQGGWATGRIRDVVGRVVNRNTREPVSGALVQTRSGDTRTDADGRFRMRFVDIRTGNVLVNTVRVIADGYADSGWKVIREPEFVIEIAPGFVVAGSVVDRRGRPVVGVHVKTYEYSESQVPGPGGTLTRDGWTDADGRFRITDVCPAEGSILLVGREGFGTLRIPLTFPYREEGEARLDLGWIEIGPAHAMRVRVLGLDGKPAVGAAVTLHVTPSMVLKTGADGRVTFGNLAPGSYGLSAPIRAAPYLVALTDVVEGRESTDVTLAPRAGRTLTVEVRDEEGRPVPGALWHGSGHYFMLETGEDGRVTIHGLPEANLRLPIGPPHDRRDEFVSSRTARLMPAGQTEVVVLRRRIVLSGHVLRADGRPASGARLEVTAVETDEPLGGGRTGEDGDFTLGVPGGIPLRVEATLWTDGDPRRKHVGCEPVEQGAVRIAGAPSETVKIRMRELDEDRTLHVRVLDADGTPVPDATVEAGWGDLTRQTDAEGRAHFENLKEWKSSVDATWHDRPQLRIAPARIRVVPAGQKIELRYRRAVTLIGRALLPDGTPAVGAEVTLSTRDGVSSRAETDETGRFRVPGLPGEPHGLGLSLRALGRLSWVFSRQGVVPGTDEIEVRLRLCYR